MSSNVIETTALFKTTGEFFKLQPRYTQENNKADVIDVEEVKTEDKIKTVLCIIDKNNIDSMLAAALWISKIDINKDIDIHGYHPLETTPPVGDHDQVMIFGCNIPEKYLTGYKGKHNTTLFTYRNMYEKSGWPKLDIVRPCDDWYTAEQALVDNSIAYTVNQMMVINQNPSEVHALKSIVRDVALYINYGHTGTMGFKKKQTLQGAISDNAAKPEQLGREAREYVIKQQVKIHNLRVTLERAFSKKDIRKAIRELAMLNDPDGYQLRQEQVRDFTKTHSVPMVFEIPGKRWWNVGRRFLINVFACPTGMSRDLMKLILPVKSSCITFETMGNYKLYRIMTNDRRNSLGLAHQMKPKRIWEEGETVCALVLEQK